MLVKAYLPPITKAIFGGIFIACAMLTFGNGALFDRVFIGILIFTAIVCRNDINIVSVLLIIFTQRVVEEAAWFGLQDTNIIKELLYLASIGTIFYFWYDNLAKISAVFLAFVISAEIYWHYIDYPAPELFWHVALINVELFTRYLLFSRVSIIDKYLPNKGKSINFDWIIYKLVGFSIIVQCVNLLDYIFRHTFDKHNVLIIYHSYPYLMHAISAIAIWSAFDETYKALAPKQLKA